MTKYLLIALIIWNIIVCLVYGIDKLKAKHDHWRVPEKVLILMALFLGGLGAEFGMLLFHHKTKHKLFTIGVPICIILNAICIYLIFYSIITM